MKILKNINSFYFKLSLGSVVIAILLLSFFLNSFNQSSEEWFDHFYDCQPEEVSSEIIVVEIDDESLGAVGLWPWNRTITAELLRRIAESGAAKIGVDINFVEESNLEDDQALQDLLNEYDNIYLPIEAEGLAWENQEKKWLAKSFLRPYYFLESDRYGHVNFINSNDNIVRQLATEIESENSGELYQSFSSLLAGKNSKKKSSKLYYCPSEYFESISAKEFLRGENEEYLRELLEGKIVLIGLTSADLHDYSYTPISSGKYMFGVYLHANAVNTLLNNKNLDHLNILLEGIILLIFALVYLIYLLKTEKYTVTNLIVAVVLGIIILVSNIILFDNGILFNGWYFLLVLVILYLFVLMTHYVLLYLSKQDMRKLFSFYLSEAILEDLLDSPKEVKLGGVRKDMTVLFSDLRGFTTLSEGMTPEELVSILNTYLTEMTKIVFDYHGVIDKYMGDAVMAFWGAPLDDEDQVERACLSALKMKNHLDEMNKNKVWCKDDVELKLGIGINSGEMIVGNMGGSQRFDYTVMGDSVNLGARLEGLNKIYGTEVIVSQYSYEIIKDKFICRLLDKVAVKGKTEPVLIYELVDRIKDCDEVKIKEVEMFNKMIALYLNKNFEEALSLLNQMDKNQKFVKLYIDRINDFIKNPPGDNWNGVFVLKTK